MGVEDNLPENSAKTVSRLTDGVLLDRFVKRRDESAFALLMERHGAYVLGVCRRATRNQQDSEDVFQACFLELARNARSIRRGNSVVGWLQTVALRLARKARARQARRQHREVAAAQKEARASPEDVSWREVRQILEEELAKLPEKLRSPIILCLFQGQTRDEAAQYLEVSGAVLKYRLQRGRELLQARLTRRGVTLAVLGALLSSAGAEAAVPPTLSLATLQGATALINKAALGGIVSPGALALAGSSSLMGGWSVLAGVLAALAVAGGAFVAREVSTAPPPATMRPAPQPLVRTVQRSFRGRQFDGVFFQFSGPAAQKFIRLEDEGLRITLPPENGPGDAIGVRLRYPVRGDFEVEAAFEVLHAAPALPGRGVGVSLYFFMESPEWDGLWAGKYRDEGPAFTMGHRVKKGKANRVYKALRTVPTEPETGVACLRVVRNGAIFRIFTAEGEAGEFEPLRSLEASDLDVMILRFAADPTFERASAIDARLIDFSITAENFVGYHPNPPAEALSK